MKKTLLYGFIFIALLNVVKAQTAYNMGNNGTISNACGGIFYDSGGPGGNYQDNENFTQTFCAPAGQYITFTFTSFSTESFFDVLSIYNGPNSSSPLLGSYSGITTIPTIYSSLGGCVTFVFSSDFTNNDIGWEANINCTTTPPPPPPPGGVCASANPFCTGINYSFPNTTGNSTGLGSIDCLGSTPNPVWYFMQIGTAGNLTINIAQTDASGNALDVDFDCWGPFTDLSTGCSAISAGTATSQACSYSASNTETCTINNAQVGQYYVLLLTNFSGQPGTITFGSDSTSSTGSTNCNIVNCGVTATNTGPYCLGQTITLNAATTNTTATTYSWTGPGGYTDTGQVVTIPNSTLAMSGTYSVTGTTGGTVTCVATTSVVVTTATVSVTSATVCAGDTGTLTASNANTYAWNTGATTTSITDNPAATTVYTVTGTIGTCTAAATATITVIPNPVLTAVNSSTICNGNSVVISASGATTYNWSPATGLSSTNTSSVTANPPTNTTYTITGSVGTCSAIPITTSVFVVAATVPTVTSNTPCVNQTLNLNCNPGTYTNYLWSGPSGFTSTAQNPTKPAVAVSASGTYSLLVTDANNCINTATVNVVVNPLPIVTGSVSPACLNFPISLSATPTTYTSYVWLCPNGNTLTGQNPQIPSAALTDQGAYHVLVTDNNGCQGTNTIPIQVIVYIPPTVKVNDTTVCFMSTGSLIASGAANYSWNPLGDLNTNVGNIVLVTPSTIATTVYTVTGQDINGCVNTATATVRVNPLPIVNVSPTLTKGCTPQCATYTASSSSGASAYSWNFGNNQYSTNASPVACFTLAGSYTVKLTLTDTNHCKNTATASVQTYPIPAADFYYTPDPVSILEPTVTFFNTTTGPKITNYYWDFGDSLSSSIDTSNLTTPKHLYLNVGSYPVTLIALSSNGCSDTVVKNVVIEQDFALFVPNSFSPNGDGRNEIFKAEGEGIIDFKMYIFDRWGNNVFTTTDINVGWDGRMHNKTSGETLQHDVYVWKIDLKNVSHQGKTFTGTVTLLK